jgi:hypothetical protein
MRQLARSISKRVINPIHKVTINNDLPKINMVFFGNIDWIFEKILNEYTKQLSHSYNIIPSYGPISNCDVYQYWRPVCPYAQRLFSKIPSTHEFFTKGLHMIHDSPYDYRRHNTDFRLKIMPKFNQVLCTSKEQYDFYGSKTSYDNLNYIPLGVFKDRIIKNTKINKDKKLKLGFVARLYPDKVKGEDELIEIAKKLDPLNFEFVIHSPNAHALIQKLKFCGFNVFNSGEFDILIICSKNEGTPLPLLESCAGGTYVLSTSVGESRWMLPENQLCKTVEEFVIKLNMIYSNRELLENAQVNLPKLVRSKTWDNHTKQLEHVWYKIMNKNEKIKIDYTKELKKDSKESKRIFIIGGAPTVNDIDLSLLENEDVMCVNKSIELFDNPKYFVTMDYTFFKKINDPDLNIISKSKNSYFILNNTKGVFSKLNNGNLIDNSRNVEYKRLNKFNNIVESIYVSPFSNSIEKFANGGNSGFCAIQLALLLGYDQINLIGLDLQINENQNTHYHNAYDIQSTNKFNQMVPNYQKNFDEAFKHLESNELYKIRTVTSSLFFEKYIKKITIEKALENDPVQSNLMVVGYYTENTEYEEEAKRLIESLNDLNINHDIVGVNDLGNWQLNTRYKAKFLSKMLNKHKKYNLLYVDVDAVIHKYPELFTESFDFDIAVRWQDFYWIKNECLSGTIYLANNPKTKELCKRWEKSNIEEGKDAKTFEQWNLGKIIIEMRNEGKIKDFNLPPEYTMIFDSMRSIYPYVDPVIEHFQASRKYRNKKIAIK